MNRGRCVFQVKIGVNRSLHDEAISVREAAVDLLGRHIGTDIDLAMTFFDLIGQVCGAAPFQAMEPGFRPSLSTRSLTEGFPRASRHCTAGCD